MLPTDPTYFLETKKLTPLTKITEPNNNELATLTPRKHIKHNQPTNRDDLHPCLKLLKVKHDNKKKHYSHLFATSYILYIYPFFQHVGTNISPPKKKHNAKKKRYFLRKQTRSLRIDTTLFQRQAL